MGHYTSDNGHQFQPRNKKTRPGILLPRRAGRREKQSLSRKNILALISANLHFHFNIFAKGTTEVFGPEEII